MDIDLLSKMVKELILDNDKVVLPGLGCFVAEIVPAYFSDKGYTINPPYRKLYFRARPDEGDSLIFFYSKYNNVPYDIAEKVVKGFVSELKSVLLIKKVVVFPGLGRLRATKENNVFFIADENLDIYPEGFGLGPISLKTHHESPEEVSAAVSDLKTILVTEPDPTPVVSLEPEPLVEPEAEPEPLVESEAEPEPLVESEAEPEPLVEPEAESEPLVESEAEPEQVEEDVELLVEPMSDTVHEQSKVRWGRILMIALGILLIIVLAYMAVGRLCPEWIDQFLYTPQELEILKY